MNDENAVIDRCRQELTELINEIMEANGNNFEQTQFILESALDFALSDKRNEVYK